MQLPTPGKKLGVFVNLIGGAVVAIHPINIEIGRRIRQRRAYLRITQQQIADSLGITAQQVQKYENGKNAIPVFRLVLLLEILDVSPDYFL